MKELIKRILKEETSNSKRMDVNSLRATQNFWVLFGGILLIL